MNRTLTCQTILAMLLLAIVLCIKQTLELRGELESWWLAILLSIEGIATGVVIASSISLLRRSFIRQKRPVSRRQVAVAVQA